jgi:hypothetical protein
MAAGLGFKTFNTGDVLSAADTNGYLMQGVLVFADSAARSAAITSPQEGQFSFLKDTNSTEYYTGAAWASVGGGGGKVLQVVNATVSTQASTTSTSYTDTGLTANITPSSASSKVLVILMQNGVAKVGDTSVDLKLVRAGSDITQFVGSAAFDNGTGWNDIGTAGITYLDSPATTSATTYKTQFKSGSSGNTAYVQLFGADSSDMAKSSITLIEIGA